MVQLWVNLRSKNKMTAPGYQSILPTEIPSVDLPDGAGRARIIAGDLGGAHGPARTFTPINVWDVRLNGGKPAALDLPDGHTAALVVLSGRIKVDGDQSVGEAQMALLGREERGAAIEADGDAVVLVLSGEPIDEPVVGHGPFVMNSQAQIREAIADFKAGRFGRMTAA